MQDKIKNMKTSQIPPYVDIDLSKEVIFYISKDSETIRDVTLVG